MRRFQIIMDEDRDQFSDQIELRDDREALAEGLLVVSDRLKDLGLSRGELPAQLRISVLDPGGETLLRAEIDLTGRAPT